MTKNNVLSALDICLRIHGRSFWIAMSCTQYCLPAESFSRYPVARSGQEHRFA